MQRIVECDAELAAAAATGDREAPWRDGLVRAAKRLGFSDRHLGRRLGLPETAVRAQRIAAGSRRCSRRWTPAAPSSWR